MTNIRGERRFRAIQGTLRVFAHWIYRHRVTLKKRYGLLITQRGLMAAPLAIYLLTGIVGNEKLLGQ